MSPREVAAYLATEEARALSASERALTVLGADANARNWKDVCERLEAGDVPEAVRLQTVGILTPDAAVEARVVWESGDVTVYPLEDLSPEEALTVSVAAWTD